MSLKWYIPSFRRLPPLKSWSFPDKSSTLCRLDVRGNNFSQFLGGGGGVDERRDGVWMVWLIYKLDKNRQFIYCIYNQPEKVIVPFISLCALCVRV